MKLTHRKAQRDDLPAIVGLLLQDEQANKRGYVSDSCDPCYVDSFDVIDRDPNHYLMVVCDEADSIVGTCHLTLLPSLTFSGSLRLQIEAVRVKLDKRGQGIGEQMMAFAMAWGKQQGAVIVQLTTHKARAEALRFYEKQGFTATHIGMKLYVEA